MLWGIGDHVLEAELMSQTSAVGVHVRRRCADAVELMAAIALSPGVSVMVSTQLPRISPELLATVAEQAGELIVLAPTEADAIQARSWGLGRTVRIPQFTAGAGRTQLANLLNDCPQEPVSAALGGGQVMTMWSAVGSTGRSTIALGLAESWAQAGERVLLIDADTYAPSLATAVGISEDLSGLVVACRYADQNSLNARTLSGACRELHKRLWVLTGISEPSRWAEVRPLSFGAVIQQARMHFDRIVIDISPILSEEFDPRNDMTSRLNLSRNIAGITALKAADHVAIVVRPDAVGGLRLIQDFNAHAHYFASARKVFIVNRVDKRQRAAVEREFTMICGRLGVGGAHPSMTLIPNDSAVQAMCQSAATMSEVAGRSQVFKALQRLAQTLRGSKNNYKVTNFRPLIKFLSVFRGHADTTTGCNRQT
jgi:MinD-like ATPase involved in chromosome partitioning or flagellar assembly